MPLSRRYHPEHPPGESCLFGMEFSFVLPPNTGISSGSLQVFTNTFAPALASEWTVGPVQVQGTAIYAQCSGGTEGTDYQFRWVANDTGGNVWPRVALCLCAQTS